MIRFNPENEPEILNDRDNPYIGLKTSQNDAPFTVGTGAGPHTIDPVNCWDSSSRNVIDQVAEGLFGYNLSDFNMPRIPLLASGYWWQDTTHLQITLRQDVMFQDGAVWNSTSAKWNFDRIMYLTNATGTLPVTSPLAEPASLYFFNMTYNDDGDMMGGTPIIKSVTAVGEWNLTIVLYAPFAPFLDLLCFEASFMVSPSSTPADRFLTLSEKLVGTGPFTFDSFTPNVDVRFSRWEDYWQGMANISKMVFSIIEDPVTLYNGMLNHDIDYLINPSPSFISIFETDPSITVKHFTDDTGIPGLSYYYLGFNNHVINQTMRKAISYAINYSYIIDQMANGLVVRANSPISPGFGTAYNASVKAASYNLAKARQTLIESIPYIGSLGLTANNDTTGSVADAWKALDLGDYNYSYNTDNSFRSDLLVPLQDWCAQIGVHVIDNGGTWDDFLTKLYLNHYELGLYWVGWGPDYLDPFNMLDPLFNPASSSDSAQVNDPTLNTLLKTALRTTDQVARDNIYKHIQYYLANVLYPHAFGYNPKITIVHSANLTNVPYNAQGSHYFYQCNWIPQLKSKIFIDDHDPNYNWTKTAFENEWCTGAGTLNDPYIIEDLEIDGGGSYNGIEIRNSNVYFKIENCTIHNTLYGISLTNTSNSWLHNNTIDDAYDIGINLENSNNNNISDNRILNIDSTTITKGIVLSYSHHNTLTLNEIKDPTPNPYSYAISLMYSNDSIVTQNTISQYGMGIYSAASFSSKIIDNDLSENQYGIGIIFSYDNIIKDNYVFNSSIYGIALIMVNNTKIINNQIIENFISGVVLDYNTYQNELYLNSFIGNGLNAQDNGTLNEWDNGTVGNFWDDYSGVDLNDDGIGDTPYLINGEAGSYDNYPIFDDGPDDSIPPIISVNFPINGETFSDSAPIYDISILEDNLDKMWYTMDGGLNYISITSATGTLEESIWNTLPDGLIIIRFYANDTSGNIGSVQVSIQKDTTAPLVVINMPHTGDEYTTNAPGYDIDVTENNLHTVWYTLNNGVSTIITAYTGTIDENLWKDLPNGQVTITFYANDTAGNLGSDSVNIYKNPPSNTSPFIPGPNTILIFFIALVGIIGLSWRNSKKIKTN